MKQSKLGAKFYRFPWIFFVAKQTKNKKFPYFELSVYFGKMMDYVALDYHIAATK